MNSISDINQLGETDFDRKNRKWVESPLFWAILETFSGLLVASFLALLPSISINGAIGIVVAYFAFIIAINTMVFSHLRKTHEEEFVNRVEKRTLQRHQELTQTLDVICSCLEHFPIISNAESKVDKNLHKYAQNRIEELVKDLNQMAEGKLRLNKSQYYDEICEIMDEMLPGDKVFATNYIDETRWDADSDQKRYWRANKKARRRGVEINRIFILTSNLTREEKIGILQEQSEEGVTVYANWDHEKLDVKYKRDLVIFQGKKRYDVIEDFNDPTDINLVTSGLKFVYEDDFLELKKLWKELEDISDLIPGK